MAEHILRWLNAEIWIRDDQIDLRRLEAGPAPSLRSLEMESCIGNRVIDIFQGSAPSLLVLSLTGIALLNWTSPLLHGLRELSLTGITTMGPTLYQTLKVLQKLRIKSVAFAGGSSCFNSLPPKFCKLPHLHTIVIEDVSPPAVTSIVRALEAPDCTHGVFSATVGAAGGDRGAPFNV